MSDSPEPDARSRAAARVLQAHGLPRTVVRAAGPEGEVAVLSLPLAEWPRLLASDSATLVAAVKAEGFRYVALDLDSDPAGA